MTIHKRTRLTPIQRQELYDDYHRNHIRVCDLIRKYRVSAPTVYKILRRGRQRDFSVHKSVNARFRTIQYGLMRIPRTNGKAERVIRTLMQMWHRKTVFKSRAHRKVELIRFVNWYNTVKPHASLNNKTPLETLINYFYPTEL